MGSLLGCCCFGSAGRPKQEAQRVEKDAPKDGSPPGQATGAVGCSASQVHASRPATLSSTPQITVQVYNVEQLARLHPRVLERMPHLLALSSPGAPGPWNAQSAVAGYWQLQEAMESAEDPQLGLLLPWQEMLFLKPVAINSAAGALLGCAPSLSECTRMLAQQLLFQCQAPLQQPTLTSMPESSSLAAVMFEVAAHTLRCTPSLSSAEPSTRNPGRIATCSEPHTAIDRLPKEAQCGDGLIARVYAAYCTAPGGSLDPVLILEHSVAKGVITGSQPRDSWLPPPSGSSATSMGESGESPKMVRVSCVDASLHHYVPPSPHPNDGVYLARMPSATPRIGSFQSTPVSSASNVFLPRRSSLGATKPRLIAETAHSCQPHTSQPQAEQALGAGFGFSAPESFPGNHQQPAQVQNACPPMQSPKERSLLEETSVQKQHSRALAILNEVPVIATLFNVEGHIVYQNEASLSYWGLLVKQQNSNGGALDRDLVNVSGTCNLSALLEALLPNSPEAIQELLEIVGEGLQWQRVLAVRPPKARSQAEASVTPAAFSQRSRRASIASSNAAGSSGKDRSGWHHAGGGINRGNSCGSSADALGGSAAKEPQEQPCSATQQALLQNVQKTQPEWQLHRQQTQPPPKQPGQLHRQQTQPPPKQPGQQRLLRRAVSFASDHFAPGDVKQEEHSKQQDTAFEGDFFCQASMNGDPPFNSNPAPEIQARGLERASTDPGLRIPSILSKNGLPCHSNLGRDSLQDEAASLKHMSLSSSQHVGKHVQDCKLTSTSEDCNATRGDAKGLPVPPRTPAQASAPRPIATVHPANSHLSSQELDEASGLPSFTKLSCPAGTPRGRSNFLMSSDGVVNPRGSQHQTEASSGPSNVVTASRTKRSGLAVEPSSRVMSLIQGTTTSAHDSISGEGALNRKGPRRRRKKLETRRTRNVTISHFHTLNAAAEFSKNGNKASKDNSTALLDADLTSRSSPALDPSQVHGPASVQLSALLSDDGSSSQQHPQQQQDGMHSSQSQHENDSDESCFLPVYPSLDRGMPDLEVPALQNLLDLPGANSPRESRSKRKHAYKRSQSSPLQGMDIISGLDSKGHTSSERGKSSTGCGSPSAVSWEGFSLTRNSTYESLDCTSNPECTSATASVADSYKTAGDSPDVLSCGAKLEPGAQQQAVPVPGEQQQQHETEHQGWHNSLPQQHYPHHQQHQQPHPPQLLTSSSRDEHSFCHLAAETSMEDGQQELYGSGMPSTELCWHEVLAMAITDPVTGHAALLLLQTDITSRALLESRMASLTESQLAMLEQMFPRHVLEYMVTKQPGQQPAQADTASHLASSHENVTILFTDIVGFTNMSKEVKPDQVMAYLNELFTAFDALVDTYEIYKVETAGDCYIAAGGLTKIDQDGFICIDHEPDPVEAAHRVLSFAKALLYCAKTVMMPHNGQPTRIRVGMHTGPAVTGLIGTKLPKYSVFGDTMNTASRMESSCPYGCIQISDSTHALLTDHPFKPTGGVEVKGKGRMETFIWDPEEEPNYTIPPDVVNAVVRAKEAVHEEEDASGYSLSRSLPLQGEFAERAQQHDMRYACAEDWSEIKRKSTGAASSTLSYKGAPHEMEGLHDLQQQGPQQEQAHAQYVRVRSAPLTQNRHPLTALHNLQSCFLLASPHPLGPMPQSPPCLPGQDPSWPRTLQHGDAVLQPAGSRSSRSLGGSKYPSLNNSKGDVPPGTGTPPSSDSMYSQLRQSLGDLAMGHHPLGSSRLSGSSSPFAKTSLTTRPRSQQQVDLGLGPAGMGQQVPRRASDNLGLGHLFQLPSSPRLPQGDAHAPQAGAPRVQHSSCQGLPGSAALAKPAERRLHSWTHSVVGAPQQASPAEPAKSSSPSPSSAGVAHTAEAQGPPPEAAAAASSMTPNAPSLKQPDIPTAMLQSLYHAPLAQHQDSSHNPQYLIQQLVQEYPHQSHQRLSRSATLANSGEIGATSGRAPSRASPAAAAAPASAGAGPNREGGSVLAIRRSQTSSDLAKLVAPGVPDILPMVPGATKRRPSYVMQAHVKTPAALLPSYLLGGLDQNAIMPATAPRPPRCQATTSAAAIQKSTSEGKPAIEALISANPATHPNATPGAQRPMRRKPQRFMSQLVLQISNAEKLQSAAEAAAAPGWPDAPASPSHLWRPRTRRGSVTTADDASPPGAPGSHDTPASPSQLWRPRTRRGSVTIASDAALPGAAGCQGTLTSPFQVQHPRSRRGSVTIAGDAALQGAPGSHDTHASHPFMVGCPLSTRGSVTFADNTAPPGANGSHGSPASAPSLSRPSRTRRGSSTIAGDAAPQGAPGNHNTPASSSLSRRSRSRQGSVTIVGDAAPPGAPGSHNTPAGPSLLRRSLSRRGSVTIVVEISPQGAPAGHDTPASPPSMSGHSFSRRGSVTFSEEAASVANSPVFSSAALCGQQLGGLGSARSRRASARSIECGTHSFSSTSNGGLDKTQMAGWTGDRTLSSGSKQSSVHHEHMRGEERALAPQDENQPYLSSVRGGLGSQVMQTKNSFRLQQESGAVVEESEAAPPTFAACVPPAQGDPPAGRRSPSVLGQQLHSMLTSGAFAFPQHNNMRSVTAPQGRHEGLFPPQPQQAQRGRRSAELSRPASGRQRGAVSQLVRRSSFRLGMQHEPAKGAQESV